MRRESAPGESAAPDIDALQAKLFFLVSRYSFRPSPAIADRVIAQLDALARHPYRVIAGTATRIRKPDEPVAQPRRIRELSGSTNEI